MTYPMREFNTFPLMAGFEGAEHLPFPIEWTDSAEMAPRIGPEPDFNPSDDIPEETGNSALATIPGLEDTAAVLESWRGIVYSAYRPKAWRFLRSTSPLMLRPEPTEDTPSIDFDNPTGINPANAEAWLASRQSGLGRQLAHVLATSGKLALCGCHGDGKYPLAHAVAAQFDPETCAVLTVDLHQVTSEILMRSSYCGALTFPRYLAQALGQAICNSARAPRHETPDSMTQEILDTAAEIQDESGDSHLETRHVLYAVSLILSSNQERLQLSEQRLPILLILEGSAKIGMYLGKEDARQIGSAFANVPSIHPIFITSYYSSFEDDITAFFPSHTPRYFLGNLDRQDAIAYAVSLAAKLQLPAHGDAAFFNALETAFSGRRLGIKIFYYWLRRQYSHGHVSQINEEALDGFIGWWPKRYHEYDANVLASLIFHEGANLDQMPSLIQLETLHALAKTGPMSYAEILTRLGETGLRRLIQMGYLRRQDDRYVIRGNVWSSYYRQADPQNVHRLFQNEIQGIRKHRSRHS